MITLETKAKIFAQYYPCNYIADWSNITRSVQLESIKTLVYSTRGNVVILLKPLSAITNEDAIDLIKIMGANNNKDCILINGKIETKNGVTSIPYIFGGAHYIDYLNERNLSFRIGQYLQSRGYALPYMECTVEQLIEAGVYKIIE